MLSTSHPLRGPILMILATGSYVANDTLMKLATEGLPPYQVLVMRGIAASIRGFPLLLMLGRWQRLLQMFDSRVLTRDLCETGAILCFIVALANMPIADDAVQMTRCLFELPIDWAAQHQMLAI